MLVNSKHDAKGKKSLPHFSVSSAFIPATSSMLSFLQTQQSCCILSDAHSHMVGHMPVCLVVAVYLKCSIILQKKTYKWKWAKVMHFPPIQVSILFFTCTLAQTCRNGAREKCTGIVISCCND